MSSESKICISEPVYKKKSTYSPLFNVEERILEYKSKLVQVKVHRQIKIYSNQARFQPRLNPEFTRRTNIVIIDKILFKSFNNSIILN